MLNIRPVSDLRNRFSEVEEDVLSKGEPVFLTKNGYGSAQPGAIRRTDK